MAGDVLVSQLQAGREGNKPDVLLLLGRAVGHLKELQVQKRERGGHWHTVANKLFCLQLAWAATSQALSQVSRGSGTEKAPGKLPSSSAEPV